MKCRGKWCQHQAETALDGHCDECFIDATLACDHLTPLEKQLMRVLQAHRDEIAQLREDLKHHLRDHV